MEIDKVLERLSVCERTIVKLQQQINNINKTFEGTGTNFVDFLERLRIEKEVLTSKERKKIFGNKSVPNGHGGYNDYDKNGNYSGGDLFGGSGKY